LYLPQHHVQLTRASKQTKKKRSSRRAPTDTNPTNMDEVSMEIDKKTIIPRPRDLDTNFVDDDELQAMLARSRRVKTRITKKITPEDVAKKSLLYYFGFWRSYECFIVASERVQSQVGEAPHATKLEDGQETNEGGITFDDTSEFVRSITYDPTALIKSEPRETNVAAKTGPYQMEEEAQDGDIAMLEAGEVLVKEEEEDDNEEAILNALEDAIKITEAEEITTEKGEVIEGTSGEQSFSRGLASTLNILRQQGLLAGPSSDQTEREKTQLQRDLWLAEHRRRLAQRELERQMSRGGNKDQAQREYENRLREQQEARENLEAFKNYKPDVNIVYYDEFGRTLTPKEAWKALSHKFHGKGSGKMKTEKRLKKIAEEKKKEAMTSGDTPLSMNRAFQIRQEKAGQAHFVLSVGNRGYVKLILASRSR
jgi:U4/U6.U5 tri-snRNP-associated protein 1